MKFFRLHSDNTICVTAFESYQGCRNSEINAVMKYLINWQLKHQIELEIVYINTKSNEADRPSREIIVEELAVTNNFLRLSLKNIGPRDRSSVSVENPNLNLYLKSRGERFSGAHYL